MRNVVVRERVGVTEEMSKRVDRKVLKWFGHVERMGDERLTKKVYKSEVDGVRGRGRPHFRHTFKISDITRLHFHECNTFFGSEIDTEAKLNLTIINLMSPKIA